MGCMLGNFGHLGSLVTKESTAAGEEKVRAKLSCKGRGAKAPAM